MSDSRVNVPAAYAVIVEHLRREILLGSYSPGDKLPPEREHAEQLGVSRVTLREAVRVLEGEGLVEVRRGSMGGTTICDGGVSSAKLRRRLRGRLDEVRGVQEFRLAIEPLAAARAAERRSAAALRTLQRSVEELQAAHSIGGFRRTDSVFHLTLARSAACAPLLKAVEEARMAMFEPIDAVGFEILAESAVTAHAAIVEAVRDRDSDAAREAMAAHVRETTRELEALF